MSRTTHASPDVFGSSIATYYTCFETLVDHFEVDRLAPVQQAGMGDVINPLLAGASTGLLYKSAGEKKDIPGVGCLKKMTSSFDIFNA